MTSTASPSDGSGPALGPAPAPAAASSAAYSTAVSRIHGRSNIPDEAASNPHHVLKGGTVAGFKNPHLRSTPYGWLSLLKNIVL